MIFEFLDANKKRIVTPTGETTFEGMVRQDTNDRIIKDSLEVDFDIKLFPIIQRTTYIYLGDNDIFRVNPLYKVANFDVRNGKSVKVTGLPQAMESMDKVELSWEGIIEGTTRTEVVVEVLPYERKYLPNNNLFEGQTEVYQQGEDGEVERTYVVGLDYGQEIDRLMIKEVVIKPAKDLIIYYGTMSSTYTEIETEIEYIRHDYEYIDNPELPVWESGNVQEGQDGEVMITYEVTYVNGEEVSRIEIDREVIIEPKNSIHETGTNPNSRIEYFVSEEEEGTPYETEVVDVEGLPEGYEYVKEEGQNGTITRFFDVYYLNDEEVKREPNYDYGSHEIEIYPENRVILKGVTEYEYETEVETEPITVEVVYTEDEYLPVGEEYEGYVGAEGVKGIVYKVEQGGRVIVNEITIEDMIPREIIIGTATTRYREEYRTVIDEYETEYVEGYGIPEGEQFVDQEGIDGIKEVWIEIEEEYIDGVWVVVNEEEVGFPNIIQHKQNEIIVIGMGERPDRGEQTLSKARTVKTLGEVKIKTLSNATPMGFLTYISTESEKIGYELDIITTKTEEYITKEVVKYLDVEFTLGDAVRAIAQVIGGMVEFGTEIDGDRVKMVTVHINEKIGKNVKTVLDLRTNIESYSIKEQREGVVTAIEYTGAVINEETGEELTLNTKGESIPSEYILPNSGRKVYLDVYVDSRGVVHYILEDKESTKIYGNHSPKRDVMHPVIESHSNKNIQNIEDLVQEAIRELDGKNLPKTQYRITASVKGLNVMDTVRVVIPEIKVDRNMPVLTVEYETENLDISYITVGEHIPTQIERIFEELPKSGGSGGGGRGETVYVMYQDYYDSARLMTYTGDYGVDGIYSYSDLGYKNPIGARATWKEERASGGLFSSTSQLEGEELTYARKMRYDYNRGYYVQDNRVFMTTRYWSVGTENHREKINDDGSEIVTTKIPELGELPKWLFETIRDRSSTVDEPYYSYIYYDRSRRWRYIEGLGRETYNLTGATEGDYINGLAFRVNNYLPLKLHPESYNLDAVDYRALGGLGSFTAPTLAIDNVIYEVNEEGGVLETKHPFTYVETKDYINQDGQRLYFTIEPFIPGEGTLIEWTYRYGIDNGETNHFYNYPGWLAYLICMNLGVEYDRTSPPEEFIDWNRRNVVTSAYRTDNIQPDGRSFTVEYLVGYNDRATMQGDGGQWVLRSDGDPIFMPYIWFNLEEAKLYDEH